MSLTVGSVFSGIGGFEEGFRRSGARTLFSCEIDPKCRQVLARHFPGVPRAHDIKEITGDGLRAAGLVPDVLVGGFPCQDVSVAGRRAGLDGERSGLFWELARLLDEAKPEWIVIENVPGLLSSAGGRDMGAILWVLADLGYMGAWRVLDAQWFGVAQRRRRVLIVGHLGDGERARQVLLEPEGGGGDPPASRAQVSGVAGTLGSSPKGSGRRCDFDRSGAFIPTVSPALCAQRGQRGQRYDHNEQAFLPVAYGLAENQRAEVLMTEEYLRQLTAGGGKPGQGYPAVAYHLTQDPITSEELTPALGGVKPTTGYATAGVLTPQLAVRRLTPTECERLQGFPDGWTDGQPDSVRYRQLGNAVCVNVVEWLARRLVAA